VAVECRADDALTPVLATCRLGHGLGAQEVVGHPVEVVERAHDLSLIEVLGFSGMGRGLDLHALSSGLDHAQALVDGDRALLHSSQECHRLGTDQGLGRDTAGVSRQAELPGPQQAREYHATDEQIGWMERFADLYRERGLIAEPFATVKETAPLCEVCPNRGSCWTPGVRSNPDQGLLGISLPWIGASYAQHRIVVIATNQANGGGLWTQYLVDFNFREEQAAGISRGVAKNMFGTVLARYVSAVLRSSEGRDPHEVASDAQRAAAWDGCAMLEAVKCSPYSPPGTRQRSTPTPAMQRNCPPLLLGAELELLRPRTLVVLGKVAAAAVQSVASSGTWRRVAHSACRATFSTASASAVEAFAVYHPSYLAGRNRSLLALQNELTKAPLPLVAGGSVEQ